MRSSVWNAISMQCFEIDIACDVYCKGIIKIYNPIQFVNHCKKNIVKDLKKVARDAKNIVIIVLK